MEIDANESSAERIKPQVYLPGQRLENGEQLVCDESAYIMLHQATTGSPCLSFDILQDCLGNDRDTYPQTAYVVAGTSSDDKSHLIVMRLSNLYKTLRKNPTGDDDDEDSKNSSSDDNDDDAIDKEPRMDAALIHHQGTVNRIRATNLDDHVIAAAWSENGTVSIWRLDRQLQVVDNAELLRQYRQDNNQLKSPPMFTFRGHVTEGYALDWCPTHCGTLASGDCAKNIHIWQARTDGVWQVDQRPLVGHTASIEDLQWSPNERHVIASCSSDRSVRIWDCRAPPTKACMLANESAHSADVNVISWNRNEPFIVSGADDGFLHVWDLRKFQQKTPLAVFKHHSAAVTSVEWHPTDSAVFCSSGEDDQIAIWDLSVEPDHSPDGIDNEIQGISPQLLFIHQGQRNIKEIHWHRQLPGVVISTAESGFNIFRTISV